MRKFNFKRRISNIKFLNPGKRKTRQVKSSNAPSIINSNFNKLAVFLNRKQDLKIKKIVLFIFTFLIVIIITAAVSTALLIKKKVNNNPNILPTPTQHQLFISSQSISVTVYKTQSHLNSIGVFLTKPSLLPTNNSMNPLSYQWVTLLRVSQFSFPIWVSNKAILPSIGGFSPKDENQKPSNNAFGLQIVWSESGLKRKAKLFYSFGEKWRNFIINPKDIGKTPLVIRLMINGELSNVDFIKVFDNYRMDPSNYHKTESIVIQAYYKNKYEGDLKSFFLY